MRWEVRIGGLGGQGAITAGYILGEAATLFDGKEAVMTEDYSPYITGGWSRADLVIADGAIDYPLVSEADVLIALSQDTLDTHWPATKKGAVILTERTIINPAAVKERRVIAVPAIKTADALGRRVVANIVMLGAFAAATGIVSAEALKKALAKRFPKAVELNMAAFDRGYAFAQGGAGP